MFFVKQIFFITFFIFYFVKSVYALDKNQIDATYDFEFLPKQWITLSDGVKLSASYWKPKAKYRDERFPIVLEVLPYRKDDNRYTTDYPIYAYLARRGIAGVRVDVRGTGSSYGMVPDREYSDTELHDIQEIIQTISHLSWCNGNVGMQGISWSAFNTLMTAMQRPSALKSILVAHGSEDLYAIFITLMELCI